MLLSSHQGLVVAGLADMTRPAEKLSTSQSAVLTATGKKGFHRFHSSSKLKSSPPLRCGFISESVFYFRREVKRICALGVTLNL